MDSTTLHSAAYSVSAFVVGACVGSFLNVCAYRIPLNRSIVHPGSHCAACGAPIPWYNNLPILSWLLLRGRSACCRTRIDLRYCLIELGMALLFLALWQRYLPIDAAIFAFMLSGIVVACLIDLDYYIIPDRFTLGGCVAGMIVCTLHPSMMGQTTALQGFSWSLASAVIGALVLLGVAWLGTLIFKKESMGMGDVKFLAAICSFLGAFSIVWVLPVAAIFGSILGAALIVFQRGAWGTRIPFGPFLGMAVIAWFFGGADVLAAWWHNTGHIINISTGPMIDARSIPSGP